MFLYNNVKRITNHYWRLSTYTAIDKLSYIVRVLKGAVLHREYMQTSFSSVNEEKQTFTNMEGRGMFNERKEFVTSIIKFLTLPKKSPITVNRKNGVPATV